MIKHKNGSGYKDPSAGEAFANIERERRREQRLQKMQALEDYEHLCRQFRALAEGAGFRFPSQIWLVHDESGKLYKHG